MKKLKLFWYTLPLRRGVISGVCLENSRKNALDIIFRDTESLRNEFLSNIKTKDDLDSYVGEYEIDHSGSYHRYNYSLE